MTVDLTRQELEQEEAIEHSIDTMLYKLRTGQPGIVIAFNAEQNTVQVQPCLQGKLRGSPAAPLPPVLDVPVMFYGAGDYVITHKPKAGDVCFLMASDRSLSRWKLSGGVVDPGERRRHDLTDSVAYFGLNAFGEAYPGIKDGIDVRTRDGLTSLNLLAGSMTLEIGGAEIFTASAGAVAFSVPITAPEATIAGRVFTAHEHTAGTEPDGTTGAPV